MKVIGAGYPKTGTKTLTAALKILGYNVYDFPENTVYLGEQWLKILRDGWTTEDFRKMYKDVDAVVDVPCFYFWEEIHKAFPDAKIILSTRDEDSWCKSFIDHRRKVESNILVKLISIFTPAGRISLKMIFSHYVAIFIYGISDGLLWKPFGKIRLNENILRMKFRAHNAHVLQNAPPDKLLVFNFAEGWEPLCKFLGSPVPEAQFPHENKASGSVKRDLEEHPIALHIKKELRISLSIIAAAVTVGGCFIYMKGPRNIWNRAANRITELF